MSGVYMGSGEPVENQKPVVTEHELELAKAITVGLNLDISPEEINPNSPLYGEGLGLDSIDMLEISLIVSRKYGVQLRSDGSDSLKIFSSLKSLNDYIQSHRTK